MSDAIDWERLARYVSGEPSAAEAAEVAGWMADDPAHRALVASLETRWRAAGSAVRVDVDRAWRRLEARLPDARVASAREADVVPLATYRRPLAKRLLPLAAAVVLAAGLALGWQTLTKSRAATRAVAAAGTVEERTGVGERRTIDLPDGSRVILGARSLLRASVDAGQGAREVNLEGEALFTVRHDPMRPFRVHAAGAVTEDLGTSFSVRAYPGDSEVRVAVEDGSVSVRREREASAGATVLRARDVAELGARGAPVVRREQPVERLLAWSRGELVFRDTPLARVITDLERWYDVDIQLADSSLGRKPFTGTFANESLDNVLQVLATALELRLERNGRTVVLRPGGRAVVEPPSMPRRVEAGA